MKIRLTFSRTRNLPCCGCLFLLLLPNYACHKAQQAAAISAADEPGRAEEAIETLQIKASPSLLQRLTIGPPARQAVAESFEVSGRVEADATRLARVSSPVRGRLTDLLALEGERVHRGQPVANLYSTELSDAQFSFIKAVSQQQLAERSTARGQQLLDADVIGAAEQQRRQAETLQASAEVSALRQQLESLGMSDESAKQLETTRRLNPQYQILASIDGTILERNVTVGQIIQPAEVAFVVADLSSVWIVADVPEQGAGDLRIGKGIEAELAAFPKEKIEGKLSFVSATVNPETRTVRVRMNLPNSRSRYKPAMLASVRLKGTLQTRQLVPVTAIVRENDHDNLFVQTAPNTFVLRQVTLGAEIDDRRILLDGLDDGEKAVLDGAFHLNNQRKKNAMGGE